MQRERLALLDGDIIAYRQAAYWGAKCDGEVDDWLKQRICQSAVDVARDWVKQAECPKGLVCLSGERSFRYDILPTYKANRSVDDRPLYLAEAKDALRHAFDSWTLPNLEADDLMAMLASQQRAQKEFVVVTVDKDLLQVPGKHYNPGKKVAREITEEEGDRLLMIQWLQGDSTDNLKGIPGIGPVKALRLVEGMKRETMWEECLNLFDEYGVPLDIAIAEYNCIRLLRWGEYDFHLQIPEFYKINGKATQSPKGLSSRDPADQERDRAVLSICA